MPTPADCCSITGNVANKTTMTISKNVPKTIYYCILEASHSLRNERNISYALFTRQPPNSRKIELWMLWGEERGGCYTPSLIDLRELCVLRTHLGKPNGANSRRLDSSTSRVMLMKVLRSIGGAISKNIASAIGAGNAMGALQIRISNFTFASVANIQDPLSRP